MTKSGPNIEGCVSRAPTVSGAQVLAAPIRTREFTSSEEADEREINRTPAATLPVTIGIGAVVVRPENDSAPKQPSRRTGERSTTGVFGAPILGA